MIYLDWNATAPLHPEARRAMEVVWERPGNAFSTHRAGRDAAMRVERAREQVAALVGARPPEVFFTSGATEANATVLGRGRWLVSAVEHPSVRAWGAAELEVDADGVVDLGRAERVVAEATIPFDGVSVMWANNETGVVQPIAEVVAWARARGLLVHVDASQAPGRVPIDVAPEFLTLSAHKAGGPQGVGALVARRPFEPLLRGGPQERGRRAGTHAVAAIVGFGAVAGLPRLAPTLRDRLEAGLVALGGTVVGSGAPRLPNTSAVAFAGVDAVDLVIALDLDGIAVSAGSACASGSPEPSHVLRAMGFPGSAVRYSLGGSSTAAEVDAAVAGTARALVALRG